MILFRYLTKELFLNTIAITLIVLLVFVTNQYSHYLKQAANGGITTLAVLKITALQIPLLMGYLLPLGFYLAMLLVFGRLYSDNEITVMSACGVSQAKLLRMVMTIALCLTVVVSVLMFWVEPMAERLQIAAFNDALKNISIAKIVPHRFQSLPSGAMFYAENKTADGRRLDHIFFAQNSGNDDSVDIIQSRAAVQENNPQDAKGGHYLVFVDGEHYTGVPGSNNFKIVHFDRLGINRIINKTQYSNWSLTAPTTALWKVRHKNLRANSILQWRLALPISVLILTLLAFPLGRINPRNGKFAKFIPAILIYVAYADLMYLGRVWISKATISPGLGLWWIHGCVLALALLLNFYKPVWRLLSGFIWRRGYAHT